MSNTFVNIPKLQSIKCFICDVDGVLSNGLLYLTNNGDEIKTFHVHDGMGLKFLMHAGIEVAVITTSSNQIIDKRMEQLGITNYFCGYRDKRKAYNELKQRLNLEDNQFAYIGDDLPDIAILMQVGFKIAVNDARAEVKNIADYITKKIGGHGAVREVCDLILTSNDLMNNALESYINADPK